MPGGSWLERNFGAECPAGWIGLTLNYSLDQAKTTVGPNQARSPVCMTWPRTPRQSAVGLVHVTKPH